MTHSAIAWALLAVVLAILEIVVPAFVFASLGVAALVAAVLATLGASLVPQVSTFVVITVILVGMARPLVRRTFFRGSSSVRTNADALPGRITTVSIGVDNARDEGQVLLDGMEWTARSATDSPIAAGARVRVARVDGIKLIVELE